MYRHLRPLLRTGLFASTLAYGGLSSGAHAAAADTPDNVQRFALVIGSNATLNPQQSPLQFADDDAARITELLREQGVSTVLVTEFDRESQALYPGLVRDAKPADHDSLLAAHRAQVARMKRAAAKGPTEYLIYYSGHGDIGPDGQGYLTLGGGTKLTRHDLFTNLLQSSPAQYNHVIVDACRSEAFVLSRGDKQGGWQPDRSEADYTQAVSDYLATQHLGNFPNTGVVLASSVDQQTHEWARYRGGVFTHELVSGLRGAADINGDGVVEYSELGAFVSAANRGVRDPRARLRVVVRPPRSDERRALLNLGKLGSNRALLFDRGDTAKYSLEDHRGIRLADIRRSGDQPGYLRLPPGKVFVVREQAGSTQATESEIPAALNKVVLAKSLTFRASTRQSRGALDAALREGLFTVPYGYGYYSGYTDRQGMLAVDEPNWEVRVYREVDGEMVEVADTTKTPPARPNDRDDDDDDDDDDDWEDWIPREVWGGFSVGTVFSTFATEDQIRLTGADQTLDANKLRPWAGPLRGIDVRWQTFTLGKRKYPMWMGYFRTGYTRGEATFTPRDSENGFAVGDATAMNYYAVPLFFGCNAYLFNDFPVRPFVGLGFGFDIVHMQYARHNRELLSDTRAKIGFELHTGVEARITNYVALRGEIQQLWSARNRFDEVPNFRNSGFTVITSLAVSLPHKRRNKKMAERRKRREERRARELARKNRQEEHIRVEIRRGNEKVVVDTQTPTAPAAPATPAAGPVTPAPAPAATPPLAPAPAPAPTPAPENMQMQPPG